MNSGFFLNKLLKMDLSQYNLKSIHKLVLIYMVSRSNNGRRVDLTIGDLMSLCSATKPTIINAIKHLESEGVVLVEKSAGQASSYRINIDFTDSLSEQLLSYLNGETDVPPELDLKSPSEHMRKQDISSTDVGRQILGLVSKD
ncbi:helix-turn-helix domain-containing protein [Vibrio sp. TRT 17S01]|uniref:helix-turn-helix domain-containing protein n=1 Tax=Vibrio sp. TRT 17S01 TaxID=3418505 RepID=UPI003CF00C8F